MAAEEIMAYNGSNGSSNESGRKMVSWRVKIWQRNGESEEIAISNENNINNK